MASFPELVTLFIRSAFFWPWVLVSLTLAGFALLCVRALRGEIRAGAAPGAGALLALLAVFAVLNGRGVPTGDEPHYLVITQSLLYDGDFDLRNNYENRDYLAYYPESIPDPHVTIVGERWYPVHGLGIPILSAPFFALAGRWGVVGLLTCMTVAGLAVLWSALHLAGLRAWPASVATLVAGFTLPLVSMSGQIFPEVPAFLIVALALRAALAPSLGGREALSLLFGVGALPWLHAKYTALAAALLLAVAMMHRRRDLPVVLTAAALLAASVIGLAALTDRWFGVPLPGAPIMMAQGPFTGNLLTPILGHFFSAPWVGLAGVLFDQQSGLFIASPVYLLAIPGIALLWRRRRALALGCVAILASVYLPAGAFGTWFGGFSSPARLLTPLVPVLALGVAATLEVGGALGRRLFALLAVPSILHAYLMAALPSFTRYGDPATQGNFFISLAGRLARLDLTLLFPSFHHVGPRTWLTTAFYLVALAALTLALSAGRPVGVGKPERGPL